MGRRKANRVSVQTMADKAYSKYGQEMIDKYGIEIKKTFMKDLYRDIFRQMLQEIESQIKDGHNVALGNIGYMDARWVRPHRTKYGGMTTGYYLMRFKYTSRLKRFIKGMQEGDFDYPYIDMYPDGVICENGILKNRREDEEFFND